MYDTNPDSIMQQFGLRDSYGNLNADWIAFEFDTYNDDQNAFGFGVTASGCKMIGAIAVMVKITRGMLCGRAQ